MRVVLDTNTVLSAILFPQGRLTWMRELWGTARIVPLSSPATSRELIRVLTYPKFQLSEEEIELLLSSYLPYTEVINVSSRKPKNLPRCRDKRDQMFIVLAAVGKAGVLVSGDRALLELKGQTPFLIETLAQFKARFF